MNRFATTILLGTMALVSCEDNSNETDTPAQQQNKIIEAGEILAVDFEDFKRIIANDTTKLWTASAFNLAGKTAFTSCRLDDNMTLNADGTYQYDSGKELCGAEDNLSSRMGIWEVNYDTKKMTFDKGTSNEVIATVITLDENTFALETTYMGMKVRGSYENK